MDSIVTDFQTHLESNNTLSETTAPPLESQSSTKDESTKEINKGKISSKTSSKSSTKTTGKSTAKAKGKSTAKAKGKSSVKTSGKSSAKTSAKGKNKSKDKSKRQLIAKANAKAKQKARSKEKAKAIAKAITKAQERAHELSVCTSKGFDKAMHYVQELVSAQNQTTKSTDTDTQESCDALELIGSNAVAITDLSDTSEEQGINSPVGQINTHTGSSNTSGKRKKETKTERDIRLQQEREAALALTEKIKDDVKANYGIDDFEALPGREYDLRDDDGIQSISGHCELKQKRVLKESVGQVVIDTFVQYEPMTGLYEVFLGDNETATWILFGSFTLDEIVSFLFAKYLRKSLFKERQARIYSEKVWSAILCYIAMNVGSNESLSLKQAYDRGYIPVGLRRFEKIVHDKRYETFTRCLSSIFIQTLALASDEMMKNYFNTNVECQQLRIVLEKLGISDIFAYDGTVCNVSPEVNKGTNVKGAGLNRTAARAKSHFKYGKDGHNYAIKLHSSFNVLNYCYNSVTITQSVDSESHQLDVKTLAQMSKNKSLVLGDRAGMAMLLFERFRAYDQYYIIRVSRTLSFPIIEAYTKDGTPIPELIGQKANSPLVEQYAKKHTFLDLVVEKKSHPVTAASIREDDFDFLGSIPEGVRQPSIPIAPFRIAVCYRELDDSSAEEAVMCLASNLPRNELNAECINDLYGLRWMVETSFKGLKQDNFLQKCTARTIEPCLAFHYASLVCFQFKSFIGNYIRCHTDLEDPEVDYKVICDHMHAAMDGLVRKRLDLLRFFQCIRSRVTGSNKCTSCNLEVIKSDSSYPAKLDSSKQRTPLLSSEQLEVLRSQNGRSFEVLLSCKHPELVSLLNGAIEGDDRCIAIFKDFDDMFSCFTSCETVKVFEKMRAKCRDAGINVSSINMKPKIPKRISLLKEQKLSLFGDLVAALFMTDYQGERISDLTLTGCLSSIKAAFWKECTASHISIKVYEGRSSILLKVLSCAIHGGFDFPAVPPAPDIVEYEHIPAYNYY